MVYCSEYFDYFKFIIIDFWLKLSPDVPTSNHYKNALIKFLACPMKIF